MEIIKAQTGVNAVQQFSALNSFKSNKTLKPAEETPEKPEAASGVKTTSTPTLLDRIDVNELRKCAETVGEYNITDDDIKYGLLYGRSVIAEWLC
jgi:hypothetical protein